MFNDRQQIDPENRYPSEGLRRVEANALAVLECLPDAHVERTRDVIQIKWGNQEGIVVLVTAEALELRLPTIEWTRGSYGPANASVLWKRVTLTQHNRQRLNHFIQEAIAARQAQFQVCQYCSKTFPPEYGCGESTCQSCAAKYEGVVH